MVAPEYGEIRTRILSELEQNPKTSLQMVADEYEWIENFWHDTARIEECNVSKINAVKQKQHKENFAHKIYPCYGCWQIHYYKECLFRRK